MIIDINWMIRLKLLNLTFVPLTNESYLFMEYCPEYRGLDTKINVLTKCQRFKFNEVFVMPKYYCHEVVVQKRKEDGDEQEHISTTLYYFCLDNEDGYNWNKGRHYGPLFTSDTIITFKEEPKLVTDEDKEKEHDSVIIAVSALGFIVVISILAVIIRYVRSRRRIKENEDWFVAVEEI